MARWRYLISYILAKNNVEECPVHFAISVKPVYWKFNKPVRIETFGGNSREDIRGAAFLVDRDGGWFAARDPQFGDAVFDKVLIFDAAIKSGALAGAGILSANLHPLDLKPLLPEGLRQFDDINLSGLFLVDRDNIDALLDALVNAGYGIFAKLQTA